MEPATKKAPRTNARLQQLRRTTEFLDKENSSEIYTQLSGKTFQLEINTGLRVVYLKDVSAQVIQTAKVESERRKTFSEGEKWSVRFPLMRPSFTSVMPFTFNKYAAA